MIQVRFGTACTAFLALASVQGCSSNNSCDSGQVLQDNVCVAGGAGGSIGAGGSPSGTGGSEALPDAATADDGGTPFGRTCVQSGISPECADPAPYCGIQPGTTVGYCTVTGCTANPSLCPSTWSCFDVGVMSFCLKP
jgi:hypothetical protein